MKKENLDFSLIIFKIFDLLILKIFTLPYKVYLNALYSLSNHDNEDSDEKNLSSEFPLYVWFVSIFNALIALVYPIGFIVAIFTLITTNLFSVFFGTLIATYFYPLMLGFIRELIQITLKTLLYLKLMSKK